MIAYIYVKIHKFLPFRMGTIIGPNLREVMALMEPIQTLLFSKIFIAKQLEEMM